MELILRVPCSCLVMALLGGIPSFAAQLPMPLGMFRGIFVTWEGTVNQGDLLVRRADDVFVCHYDSHSLMQRDDHSISVSKLRDGEPVQVLADHHPESHECYARIVEVINPAALRRKARLKPASDAPVLQPLSWIAPRGDRTLSGIVVRRDGLNLTLRTSDGDTSVRLRHDTRYVENGARTDAEHLQINARCSVRAGLDLDGDLEGFEVMWGQTPNPGP